MTRRRALCVVYCQHSNTVSSRCVDDGIIAAWTPIHTYARHYTVAIKAHSTTNDTNRKSFSITAVNKTETETGRNYRPKDSDERNRYMHVAHKR